MGHDADMLEFVLAKVKKLERRVQELEAVLSDCGDDNDHPSEAFMTFWERWPSHHRKVAKKQCWAHWRKHKLDANRAAIMESLTVWKASRQWTKEGGAFIPSPLVWLRQARWEAEMASDAPMRPNYERDPLFDGGL